MCVYLEVTNISETINIDYSPHLPAPPVFENRQGSIFLLLMKKKAKKKKKTLRIVKYTNHIPSLNLLLVFHNTSLLQNIYRLLDRVFTHTLDIGRESYSL